MKKETNFVSAVVYLSDEGKKATKFANELLEILDYYFEHYELIIVDDCCKQQDLFGDLSSYVGKNVISIIHMSVKQGVESCLSAGLDVSIGDFVFEFDSMDHDINKELVWEVYKKALEGNDVVSVETKCNSWSRKIFYKLFNKMSMTDYDINASLFRLISRRAINRVLGLNINSAFRQAVYASCGLKNASIEFDGKAKSQKARGFDLAIDSFLIYTNFPEKMCAFSVKYIIFMIVFALFFIIGKVMYNYEWIDIVLLALIFLSVAIIIMCLIVVIYYARLNLKGTNKKYLIESVEKL